jgi:multiple sugar transport system ATP-binding protein
MAAVDCEHIDKTYTDGTRALRDCVLHIDDGELMVLVGPSGCGKSTLLRVVAGLEEITAGTLRIEGRVANDLTPQQRNVAMVFQDYALYPHMTVRRNLEYPLRMRRMARDDIRKRVDWAAGLLDIGGVLDRLPRELSGGQRQRVAMGRALVREPAVFLLDEPLSNLDAKLRLDVRSEIAALQQRTGTTMIYVTHDQTEAMTLGHRVAVLDHRVIEQVAPPRELYERPASVFVAGFIGTPPMNLFATRWEGVDGDRVRIRVGRRTVELSVGAQVRRALESSSPDITVGVRPEHISVVHDAEAQLAAFVVHVENLGHESLMRIDVEGVVLMLRLPGMPEIRKGDTLRLRFDEVYFFDGKGAALPAA